MRRPGTRGHAAAPRWLSTSATIWAAVPGYQLPATAALRTGLGTRAILHVHPVVDRRKDVVALLELRDDRLLERDLALERAVEVGEARDVVARALLRVLYRRVRLH